MQFKIRNYKGASSADIFLDKITILAGAHAQGKSSILGAIAAIATANPNPTKILKKELSVLVHSGTAGGGVQIEHDEENKATIKYPSLDYKVTGKEFIISDIAAGITSIVDMNPKQRIQFISDMMDCNPTFEDLEKEFKKNNILIEDVTRNEKTTTNVQLLFDKIKLNGWDPVHLEAKEKGTKLKGQWEYVTEAGKYGVKKAPAWYPDAWESDLRECDEPMLEKAVQEASDWLLAAQKETAISEERLNELKAIALNLNYHKKSYKENEDSFDVVDKQIKVLRKHLATQNKNAMACPGCGQMLNVRNNKLIECVGDNLSSSEIKNTENEIKQLTTQCNSFLKISGEINKEIRDSESAAIEVKEAESVGKNKTEGNIEELTQNLERAKSRQKAFSDYYQSQNIYSNIISNEKIVKIIAPNGLRGKILNKSLGIMNKTLKAMCDLVKWKTVEIDDSFEILYGGMRYGHFIAKSERYRARVIFQLIVAMKEKAKFCLVDDCDELTKSVRSELLRIVIKSNIPTIIVSAMDRKDEIPDFSKIGGKSYWIKDGVAELVFE